MTDGESAHLRLIRGAFLLYESGDFDAMYALAHPDVELEPVFMPGTYRGLAAIREAIESRGDPRLRWMASGLEFHEVAGHVAVSGRLHTTAALGARLDLPIAFLFALDEGRIIRMEGHMTLSQAIESAEASAAA